jgi:sugar (pentulose or hexulose) kinase
MGIEVREPIITESALEYNFTNEGGAAGTYRFLKNIAGLWFLQELRRTWSEDDEGDYGYDRMEDWALCAGPFRSFIDVDHPSFLRPSNMPRAIADFCRRTGQPVPATKGDFTRVVLESLAFKYRLVRDALERISGRTIERVHVIGGGSQNDLLNRFTADALGVPVVAGPVEAAAIGNLIVQAMALGMVPDLAAGRALVADSFPVKVYEPRGRDEWDEAGRRFNLVLERSGNADGGISG